MAQPSVLRHYLRLSQMTMGCHITPDASLGTCTMKYSPQVNEHLTRITEMSDLHPLQDDDTVQGILQIIYDFEQMLCEISGMDAFTFQPAGGSQAIFANACIIRAYHATGASSSSATRSSPPRSPTRSIAPRRRWPGSG